MHVGILAATPCCTTWGPHNLCVHEPLDSGPPSPSPLTAPLEMETLTASSAQFFGLFKTLVEFPKSPKTKKFGILGLSTTTIPLLPFQTNQEEVLHLLGEEKPVGQSKPCLMLRHHLAPHQRRHEHGTLASR